jgi:NAD(P)-dependent dehydrogenase (short-subunit alcohol dehydrogenase family)
MMNPADIDGRVVIVTGGGGGVGRGLVRHLASAGAQVVIPEWNPDTLDEAVKELEAKGLPCLGVHTDVSQRASIEAMVDATIERFGRVDGLVNNAQDLSAGMQPLAEATEKEFDSHFNSGVKGTLWAMQAVYPHMKGAGWGRIVNVGSSAGLIGMKGLGVYGAAKEAIRSLTRSAAREWAADGIVVNCYCPVSTRHAPDPEPGTYGDDAYKIMYALMPHGYNGDPETDLGPTVAFLLSDDCRYLTGQTLTLDGGTYAFA